MGITERKARQRVEREDRIIASARQIAQAEGWGAVTVRRLADEIEYSQPVLYSHFESRDAIIAAVAVEGFRELAVALRQARMGAATATTARRDVASVYLAFADEHPALYEAMFSLPVGLRFAQPDTRIELRNAFAALAAIVEPSTSDVGIVTETLWAALHGLAELERSGRIRPSFRDARLAILVDGVLGNSTAEGGPQIRQSSENRGKSRDIQRR